MRNWIDLVVGLLVYFICTAAITATIFFGVGYIVDIFYGEVIREHIVPSLLFGGFLLQTGLIAFVGFTYWVVKTAFK